MLGPEGTPRQGCMRIRRFTDMTFLVTALAFAAILPASASAGSLLSGYGGPGQGNQAILGAALVNGPTGTGGHGGGGGGARAYGAGTQAGGASSLAAQAAPGAGSVLAAGSAAAHGSRSPAGSGRGAAATPAVRAGATAASQLRPATPAAAVSGASVGGGPTLGLSRADLLYVLLALGALLLTGVLTRRMAQRPEVETQAR